MNDRVIIDVENHIAHVTLNRADKLNALDTQMLEAICSTAEKINAMPEVRVVVLSGEGSSFCVGIDMESMKTILDGSDKNEFSSLATRTHGDFNIFQYVSYVWRDVKVPVIAALKGMAFGGGFQISLGADMRYATPDTKMSIMEIKWGLIPDMGVSQLARGLAREDVLRELTYTGRIFDAVEAKALGLVTDVVEDPVSHAMNIASTIASKNPDAMRLNKELYNEIYYKNIETGMLHESVLQDKLVGTRNQTEAIMANFEKRAPVFDD